MKWSFDPTRKYYLRSLSINSIPKKITFQSCTEDRIFRFNIPISVNAAELMILKRFLSTFKGRWCIFRIFLYVNTLLNTLLNLVSKSSRSFSFIFTQWTVMFLCLSYHIHLFRQYSLWNYLSPKQLLARNKRGFCNLTFGPTTN